MTIQLSHTTTGRRPIVASRTRAVTTLSHRLFIPSAGSARQGPAPLLVALHGTMQTPSDFAAGTEFDAVAERVGAYVLYPSQSLVANPLGSWNWFLPEHQTRDGGEVAAILAMTEETCLRYPIDRTQIFVTGISAGGAMAAILAEQAPEVFSAVGIMAGVPLYSSHDFSSGLAAMRGEVAPADIAALIAQRDGDPGAFDRLRVTIWTGSDDKLVAPSNTCVLAGQFLQLLDISEHDQTIERRADATITRWHDRSGRVRAEVWQIPTMGHAWSGGSPQGSHTFPGGPKASQEMMNFFLADFLTTDSLADKGTPNRSLDSGMQRLTSFLASVFGQRLR